MKKELIMDDIKPVFVVGHPRSGTTFLQLLISAHSNFSSGPETHLFQYILNPPISDWKCSKLNLNDLDLIFKRFAGKPAISFNDEFKKCLIDKALNRGIPPALFLHNVMSYFAKINGDNEAKRWVEKTPEHLLYIPEILSMFPKAKVINIIRDPRSVISSPLKFNNYKRALLRYEFIIRKIARWNSFIELGMKFQNRYNTNIKSVYYEDIINNPDDTLEIIMNFIGEKIEINQLKTFSQDYEKVVREFENKHKYLCETGEIIDRRDIWKKRMNENEIKLVEVLCESLIKKHNYKIESIKNLSCIAKKIWILYIKMSVFIRFFPSKLINRYRTLSALKEKFAYKII